MKKRVGILFTLILVTTLLLGTVSALAQNLVVVLDPGHGGNDTGAGSSYNGKTYNESEINLKIAKAAKKYLEKYKGVTVYMTREDNNKSLTNAQRVAFASRVGANFLLSIHCNDSSGSSTKGALAIASWSEKFEAEAASKTRDVGEKILKNYAQAGLENDGLYLKRATEVDSNYKVFYPDGTEQDYYGMTQRALRIGMPCTLMETGFMSSAYDMKILSDDSKLDALGKACAEGIASSYGLSETEAINAPDTYPVSGDNISFTSEAMCRLIYPYTGSAAKSNGAYAELGGNGADKVIALIDYMGMSLNADDYNTLTITMRAGGTCKVDVYVSSSKQWTHESVVAANNKVTFELTDEFKDYTIKLTDLPVWDTALNFIELYVTGSEHLMVKKISAKYGGNEKSPTLKPDVTKAPVVTETPKPTDAPTATPTPVMTETQATAPTEAPTVVPTDEPTDVPAPETDIVPSETTSEAKTKSPDDAPESPSAEKTSEKKSGSPVPWLILGIAVVAGLFIFTITRKH